MQIKPSLPSFSSRDIPTGQTQQAFMGERDESHAGKVLFERRKKQMHDMQTAVTKLQEMKKNASPKKMASQRAALLKQRLDTLKSIMAKLPPGNYKALAQEVKQIAKELAALSKELGNSGGSLGHMPPMSVASGETSADGGSEEMARVDSSTELAHMQDTSMAELAISHETLASTVMAAETAEAEAQQAANLSAGVKRDALDKTDEQHDSKTDKLRATGQRQSEDTDDKVLRALLTEARKTLKEVLSLLKAKHQVNDKESRKLFASIERELETLDQSLQQGALASSASELVSAGSIETGSIGGMGGFVDVSI
ncbi:hypothetical protein [Thiopseudomonas acetoxidans]|uniref:Uncharacterized protein n=1 Tax=Thiopseudomonas acetoxidans TaxID=3041622 RepID=A0ABT7SNX2_9GAMM|nr:hypothetical protein [Thiopseudomonas sp. CY1220]MDM7857893.1 hypothetical protein [Thiopseudomonas sp. CY1220]